MSTDAISSTAAATSTASTTSANTAVSLGMGDLTSGSFLKLLTVQLQN